MPFGDVSGRVGHILGPSVEFAFGQPLLGQLYELVLRSCSVLHTKHSKISCSTILMQFVRGVPLSTSLPLRAQRTAIKSSTLPTCLHCALHRAKYELCDGMMLRRSSSVPLQLSRSHPTARRRATGTPRSSRERSAPAPAGPTSSLELRAARGPGETSPTHTKQPRPPEIYTRPMNWLRRHSPFYSNKTGFSRPLRTLILARASLVVFSAPPQSRKTPPSPEKRRGATEPPPAFKAKN